MPERRGPRLTVRSRLTLLYGGLFVLSGAGLLAIVYLLVATDFPGRYATGAATTGSAAVASSHRATLDARAQPGGGLRVEVTFQPASPR